MLQLLKNKQIRFGVSRHVAWLMTVFVLASPLLARAIINNNSNPTTHQANPATAPEPEHPDQTSTEDALPDDASAISSASDPISNSITRFVTGEGLWSHSVPRDFNDILRAGKLRVLFAPREPGAPAVSNIERAMLERFAEEHDLALEWIESGEQWELLPDLAAGRGDVIIGQGQSLAAGIQDQVNFTAPWIASRQQVVVRADTTQIKSLADLVSRQVALKRSSPLWSAMEELAGEHSTMDLVELPEALKPETIMARVASGHYDLTIADSEFLDSYLPQHPDLTVAYDVTGGEPRSWAVNKAAENLQIALNQFLNRNHLEFNIAQVQLGDLPRMQERKSIRLITYKSPVNYYLSGGRFKGFEYELVRKFARAHKMRVDVVLAGSHEEMQQLLLNGEGDIIAAGIPISSIVSDKIELTTAYDFSAPLIIGRDSEEPLLDIRDLEGRSITISAESPYRKALNRIRDRGVRFELNITEPGIDTESIITMVAEGKYDLTVLDSNLYNTDLAGQYKIKAWFPLGEPAAHGWAVRASDDQLLGALDEFIGKEYRGHFYNAVYAKYIERPRRDSLRLLASNEQLSPYDDLVQRYADQYDFDWRLIVAQIYQESRFDPEAVSIAGAEGLMQIMPATADIIGAKDLDDPNSSIRAGVKYLSMLREQFEDDLPLEDRTWFTLASYNAGFGRVKQARARAEQMGLDPDRWFGNVELAMMEMAEPFEKDGEMIQNCRCGQTVVYVHEIRTLYNNYVRLTQPLQVATRQENRSSIFPFDI